MALIQVVLKIFTSEFYSIGALFAIYGAGVLFASLFRRQQGNKQFFSEIGEDGLNRKRFRTSGNVVVVLTALSVAAYGCLLGRSTAVVSLQYFIDDRPSPYEPCRPHSKSS